MANHHSARLLIKWSVLLTGPHTHLFQAFGMTIFDVAAVDPDTDEVVPE